ncbi:cytochrome c [Bradyrhizobium sp.]|uniref:c-type cytochrome n=1 Tax=Bradyrhizobium sp. TaxID=376 RepID=UPI002722C91A|nr:cytochrome c [Bradyrhizobium sp.]MDO9297444.1 cytochrome c [Bradyrhizobium sp.]
MMRTVVVVATLVLGAGAGMAQDAVKAAQDAMKANGKNIGGVLSPMFKGEKPYDQAAVDAALAQLNDTAKKLPAMFPASVKDAKLEGDFSPTPKIWSDKAGYDAAVASFAKVITEAKAKIKDLDSLKANFPAIGKECGGCHETYRLKKG